MARNLVLDEMDRIRKEVDKVFKNFLDFPKMKAKQLINMNTPKTEIKETPKEFVVKVGMPGMKKADIDLKVSSNALEIKAENKQEIEIQKKGLFKKESSYQGFHRAFPLPAKILTDKTKAIYQKGVLEIHMPKAAGTMKKEFKKIKII
ncbi:MAG: Hsp20/alpha crystallin family protein [archaeon]